VGTRESNWQSFPPVNEVLQESATLPAPGHLSMQYAVNPTRPAPLDSTVPAFSAVESLEA
jgi:hypothetical protein